MIAIIDYGAGNLFSVQNALGYLGLENQITRDASEIRKADGLILPGVGAFPDAMRMLREAGLVEVIREEAVRKPFLGICLGMQMLFDESDEFTTTSGLGLIPGRVEKIVCPYKIPHMGWNHLELNGHSPLLAGVPERSSVYFVHSYMACTESANVTAYCDYGVKIPALAEKGTVFGAQFHPEKSGETGLTILKNFGGLTR
ncbi:MAG TPA: imidazole glycerol phosphate synthase subunit HisH [Candidatus Faecivivens stercorigallinarum]|nr:imidazole glycerol phosphate synthase subunit HisH [Candidatus Faecivivens stercorigallinarum]